MMTLNPYLPPPPPPPPPRHPRAVYNPVVTQHTFHLVMSIVTLGMWTPVWFTVWLVNTLRRRRSILR